LESCVFSKHLQEYDFTRLGQAAKSIGVTGVDLTVRPKGHVEPAQAKDKLPEAVKALAAEGIRVTMITTAFTSVDDPHARTTLETAASLGIRFYKIGYLVYEGFGTLEKGLREGAAKIHDLAALGKSLGIWGGYHNHCADSLGATVVHLNRLLAKADPEGAGVFFDVGHATVEGAACGWMQGLDDVAARVRMIALKDFEIVKQEKMHYAKVVPMGEGLVQWKEYVNCLRKIAPQIAVVSFHAEFDAPAAEVTNLARSDREFFDRLWNAR
jgi:sugar phosphate isomerase/epimerase